MGKSSEEARLQKNIVRHINAKWPEALYTHCPNGGKRSGRSAMNFLLLGVRAGVPDLMFFDPIGDYIGLAIELKSKKGVLSYAQTQWLKKLEENTYRVAVLSDYDEAVKLIDNYYRNKL